LLGLLVELEEKFWVANFEAERNIGDEALVSLQLDAETQVKDIFFAVKLELVSRKRFDCQEHVLVLRPNQLKQVNLPKNFPGKVGLYENLALNDDYWRLDWELGIETLFWETFCHVLIEENRGLNFGEGIDNAASIGIDEL